MPSNPYQSLVSLLSNVLDAYTIAFFITDLKTRTLKLAAVQSLSRYLNQDRPLPLEESGILSQVQKVGQLIHMERLQDGPADIAATLPFYREGESLIKGLFAIPVADGAGVLYVDTKYQWGFNDKHRKLIHEIAGVLGDLLTKEAADEQQRDAARILDFCNRVKQPAGDVTDFEEYSRNFVEECTRLLETDYGFLALRDPDDDLFQLIAATSNSPKNLSHQHFLLKQGLLGYAFQTQKSLRVARMNPHAPDHFLFSPSEGLPHHGTLWAIPAVLASGHQIVLAFLSRAVMDWSTVCRDSILHTLQFYQLLLDKFFLKEECRHLRQYDSVTGLYNLTAFESRFDQLLEASIQHSLPLTFAIIQFNPWPMLLSGATPKQIHRLQKELAGGLRSTLPTDVVLGQLCENRFGVILPGLTSQQAKNSLSQLADFGQDFFVSRLKGIRIRPQLAWVSFPQDGTGSEELWPLAYHRLHAVTRPRAE